jgi:hypothetical protein
MVSEQSKTTIVVLIIIIIIIIIIKTCGMISLGRSKEKTASVV